MLERTLCFISFSIECVILIPDMNIVWLIDWYCFIFAWKKNRLEVHCSVFLLFSRCIDHFICYTRIVYIGDSLGHVICLLIFKKYIGLRPKFGNTYYHIKCVLCLMISYLRIKSYNVLNYTLPKRVLMVEVWTY
jgi:hypothetical protein